MTVQLRLPSNPVEKGVVYTKPWVVELILDLVGYRDDADLAALVAVEPAAGDGAFLVPMVRRLIASLRTHERPLRDARHAIVAYEIDGDSTYLAQQLVVEELLRGGYPRKEAQHTASGWVVEGDYLLSAHASPRADIVVGNPPYIRYDDLPRALYQDYQTRWPTMVGRCDLYVAFIEAGIRQLKDGGRLGFICADRWMRAAYGTALRELVATTASVEAIIEMHNAPAFEEEVSAYPAVTILRRSLQGEVVVAAAGQSAGSTGDGSNLADAILELAGKRRPALAGFRAARLSGWYDGNGPWPWAEPEALDVLRHLEETFPPLEDAATGTRVGIGVATGADKVFVTQDAECVEPDRLLPLAMAQDTRTGKLAWSGHYLVDPWGPDDRLVNLATYPRLVAYFEGRGGALRGRNIAQRHPDAWYRTIDRVTHSLLGRDKLYLADMKLQPTPALDRGRTYPHHNLYVVVSDAWDMEVLGGLLLSRITELFVGSYCVKMRGGTLRFQAQYLRRIRVPDPSQMPYDVATRLRDAFQHYDRQAATAAACEAYGLKSLPEPA